MEPLPRSWRAGSQIFSVLADVILGIRCERIMNSRSIRGDSALSGMEPYRNLPVVNGPIIWLMIGCFSCPYSELLNIRLWRTSTLELQKYQVEIHSFAVVDLSTWRHIHTLEKIIIPKSLFLPSSLTFPRSPLSDVNAVNDAGTESSPRGRGLILPKFLGI